MRIDLQAPTWATHFLSDRTDWNKAPLPVAEMAPFDLPDDVYFEYAYIDDQGRKRPDPENFNPILNPWWTFASNLMGPAYRPDSMARLSGMAPAGQVLRLSLDSEILQENRRFLVYSPAGMAQVALPHILFQDGKAYFGWGRVPQVLDRMMVSKRVGPAHLIFVPPKQRTEEYAFNPLYLRFVLDELMPMVESRVPCDGRRAAWGASLGGLFSAQLAWESPDRFQKVVCQSGTFLFSEDMDLKNPFAGNESFLRRVQSEKIKELSWYLECGTLEWLLASNRNLQAALKIKGMKAVLRERNAGHNWINWRNGMASGLEFILQDPDWVAGENHGTSPHR